MFECYIDKNNEDDLMENKLLILLKNLKIESQANILKRRKISKSCCSER